MRAIAALRTLSLARVVLGTNRATRAASGILSRRGFQYVALIVVLIVLTSSAATYFFERPDPRSELREYPQALWWAAATITTISTTIDPVTL